MNTEALVEGYFDEDVFELEGMDIVDKEIDSLLEAEDDLKASCDHYLLDIFLPMDIDPLE